MPLRLDTLSKRELDCLTAAAQHKRTKQIAVELDLQPATVDTYIARASRKLGFSDRSSAIQALIEHSAGVSGNSRSSISDVEAGARPGLIPIVERLPWPFPTRERPTNDFGYAGTWIAVLIAATMMMAVAALYILAINVVSHWR